MKKTIGIISVAVILALVLAVTQLCRQEWQKANVLAKRSALSALAQEIHNTVTAYRATNGAYPTSLNQVTITNYQDGATPAMLDEIQYESDGKTFKLSWGVDHIER
jgi:hypothetical protein